MEKQSAKVVTLLHQGANTGSLKLHPSSPETPGYAREGRQKSESPATPDFATKFLKTDEPGEVKGESTLAETGHTKIPWALPVKLHLGCGTNILPGWINVDKVAACHPDLLHDVGEPLPYPDLSVDAVLAEDLLEHFDKYHRYIVFAQWVRVLKIGGEITLQVPNLKKIIFRYFKFGFPKFTDLVFGENMLRSEIYLGHYGNHKWGYSPETLAEFVRTFGIEPQKIECPGLNVRLTGVKKQHLREEELDRLEIYSYANAGGKGAPSLTLGYVRKRMQIFQNNEQ